MKKIIIAAVCCTLALILLFVGCTTAYNVKKKAAEEAAENIAEIYGDDGNSETDTSDDSADDQGEKTEKKSKSKKKDKDTATTENVDASGVDLNNEVNEWYVDKDNKDKILATYGKYAEGDDDEVVAEFDRRWPGVTMNRHSLRKFAQQRKASGMSDAVSIAMEGNTTAEQEEFLFRDWAGNAIAAFGAVEFTMNAFEDENGEKFMNSFKLFKNYVGEKNIALETESKWEQKNLQLVRLQKGTTKYEKVNTYVTKTPDEGGVLGVRGYERWFYGKGVPREEYKILIVTLVHIYEDCLVRLDQDMVIDADLNMHLPFNTYDRLANVVVNPEPVHQQPILPYALINKDGKIGTIVGYDTRDMRGELKVTNYVMAQRAPKSTVSKPSGGSGNSTDNNSGGSGDSTSQTTPDEKEKEKVKEKEKAKERETAKEHEDPHDRPKEDGKGAKDPKNSAVANNNAPDTGHTNENVSNKGTAESRPKDATGDTKTVTSGSSESGSRTVNEDKDKEGQDVRNGSTSSSDTSTPEKGYDASKNETVDSELGHGNEQHVEEAPAHGDEGGSTQGWSMTDQAGD